MAAQGSLVTFALLGSLTRTFYHMAVAPLLVVTIAMAVKARPSSRESFPSGFSRFHRDYLVVWALCASADWLQGPYVYALYEAYGFSTAEIAQLFVGGYASSLVFGCVVGVFSDTFGRKRSCLLYCLVYIVSCLTKHFKHYAILMVGRIAGGVATSLLYSAFECWMVAEHQTRLKFPAALLDYMFGSMFTIMYCVAIASGLAGQAVTSAVAFRQVYPGSMVYVGGYLGPFDLSIVYLAAGAGLIAGAWAENYGAEGQGSAGVMTFVHELREALRVLVNDPRTLLVGVVVSTFEGTMFAFVFNWTPALESAAVPPPHGIIFALFMMACMCGSSIGSITNRIRPALRLQIVCLVGVAAFFVLAFAVGGSHLRVCFCAFLVFECLVGVYFPTVGVLKSEVVPERVRGTMYNIYRVPLNAVVLCLLLTNLSLLRCFGVCASLMFLAVLCVAAIDKDRAKSPTGFSSKV
mmetsp:Transcript_63791/g.195058  ORF Transcript_63791/g.195058 Transcript_63791/m.195058 type:complete len:464 (-) Transcript_63791:237-1628(-)